MAEVNILRPNLSRFHSKVNRAVIAIRVEIKKAVREVAIFHDVAERFFIVIFLFIIVVLSNGRQGDKNGEKKQEFFHETGRENTGPKQKSQSGRLQAFLRTNRNKSGLVPRSEHGRNRSAQDVPVTNQQG